MPRSYHDAIGADPMTSKDETPTETRHCQNCGATLTIGEGITLLQCPLCKSRAIGTSESEWES